MHLKLSATIVLTFILHAVCDGAPAGLRYPSKNKHRELHHAPNSSTKIIDLSQHFTPAKLYNANTGSKFLLDLAENEPKIRALMVLEHGELVAEYYRHDLDRTKLSPINSCTKSWISLLFGIMEKNGLISMNETLGDIWPDEDTWKHVDDADYRRSITIESLLSMTAGLKMPSGWLFDLPTNNGWAGGAYLGHALEYHDVAEEKKGQYEYLGYINLYSYIIRARTGLTPEEYAVTQVFPSLGITDQDFEWDVNFSGDSYSGFGIFMTSEAMAKLGMLYLQDGMASESVSVVDKDWVDRSTHGGEGHPFYGYLWRIEAGGQVYCATGFGGQLICVDKCQDRVLVLASDLYNSRSEVWDAVRVLPFSKPTEM